MKTLTIQLGEAAYDSCVQVDGEAVAATLVELYLDPATQATTLRVETDTRTYLLTGRITVDVETETVIDPRGEMPIHERQRVRQFADRHAAALLALERSMRATGPGENWARYHGVIERAPLVIEEAD